jgi:hypothetical protein
VIDQYKILLGNEIGNFLEGIISFDDLQDRISAPGLSEIEQNEIIKQVWHALYQYETDMNTCDVEYASRIRNRFKQIASALKNNDPELDSYIKNYFNSP